MLKLRCHPLLPLAMALVLIVVTGVFPLLQLPRVRRAPPRNATEGVLARIELPSLPKDVLADYETRMEELRKEGFTIGAAHSVTTKRKTEPVSWLSRLKLVVGLQANEYSDTVNYGYSIVTEISDGDPADYEFHSWTDFDNIRLWGVVNIAPGNEEHPWITNTGFQLQAEKCGPEKSILDALSPTVHASYEGHCYMYSLDRKEILQDAYKEATYRASFAVFPCIAASIGWADCMGLAWVGAFWFSLPWLIWDWRQSHCPNFDWNGNRILPQSCFGCQNE